MKDKSDVRGSRIENREANTEIKTEISLLSFLSTFIL